MTGQRTVAWNHDKLKTLKAAFAAHKGDGVLSITVQPEGKLDFVPSYAKYLIEYLEGQLGAPQPPRHKANEGEESTSASSTDGERWQ